MQSLQDVLRQAGTHTRCNPPAMDMIFTEEYEDRLADAVRAALSEPGADHAAIYALVTGTVKRCIDYMPQGVDFALLAGIHPNTIIDPFSRSTVLHNLLSRTYPPDLIAERADKIGLQQLLDRGATPDLQDEQGNTALHILVARIANEQAFPDPEPEAAFYCDPEYLYNDDQRADYLGSVGGALLRAGWTLGCTNRSGQSVRAVLQEALRMAQSKRRRLPAQMGRVMQMLAAVRHGEQRQGRSGDFSGAAEHVAAMGQRQAERGDAMVAVLQGLLAWQPVQA